MSIHGATLWRRLAGDDAGGPLDPAARSRFADLVGPALAAALLGIEAIDPASLAQSRLAGRYALASQRKWLARLIAEGPPIVVIKGFAQAHQIYSDPATRCMGDLDILLHTRDRDSLIALLAAEGFTFRPLPTPPWGFISTASYMPFVSSDGACNLDIHIHPDCYPAYRSLTTEAVFADSVSVEAGEFVFRAPSRDHALLLCATNAAKDKFGPFAIRKIVDAMRLVASGPIDWAALDRLARDGDFLLPWRVFAHLLLRLGVLPACLPETAVQPLSWARESAFSALLAEVQALWPAALPPLATLRRELMLCTEPAAGLHNALLRLRGLVMPAPGVPAPVRPAP